MPQAVAYAAAAVTAALTGSSIAATSAAIAAGTATLATTLIYGVVQAGIYAGIAVGTAAATAPKVPKPSSIQTPLKQAMPVRQSAFGRVRVGGAYSLYTVGTGGAKIVSYDVQALLDGLSYQFVGYYLNDDLMAQNATLNWYASGAEGKYGGPSGRLVNFDFRLGGPTEIAYTISSAVPEWTSDHRGDGVTSLLTVCKQAKSKNQAEAYPNGAPVASAVVDSQLIYDPRDGGQTQGDSSTYEYSDNSALCLLAYLTDAAGGMGLDYTRFIYPAISSFTDAADECDGQVATSGMHATLAVAASAGDNQLTLNDVTSLANGVVIDLVTESVTVSSVAGSVVTLTGTLALNHSVGELAYWDAAGQQARYRCAGVYRHDNAPGDVIKSILSTFDGWLGQRGDGALVLRTNTPYTPTVTLTDRHIVGYSVQNYLPDEQAINQLIVSYTDPAAAFNEAEAGYVQDDADIAARGVVRSQPLQLDWVPSAPQALRVARPVLARSTQALRGSVTCNLAGLAVMGERFVRLQISELTALSDVTVEVTGKPVIDLAAMTVTFPWVATGGNIADGDGWVQEKFASATFAATLDAAPTDGNYLIAFGFDDDAALTANAGAGWANIGTHSPGAQDPYAAIAVKGPLSGATAAQTPFTGSAGDRAGVVIVEVVAVSAPTSAVFDGAAVAGNATTTVNDTTTADNTLALAFAGWEAASPVTFDLALDSAWSGPRAVTHNTDAKVASAGRQSVPTSGTSVTATTTTGITSYGLTGAMVFVEVGSSPDAVPAPSPPSGGTLAPLAAPTIDSVTPQYDAVGYASNGARLLIGVSAGLENIEWKVRWKLSTDTVWTEVPVTDAGDSPFTLLTGPIATSGNVDVQVAYLTATQTSPWSSTTTVAISPPSDQFDTALDSALSGLRLDDLADVDTTSSGNSPDDGEYLKYDGTQSPPIWRPAALPSYALNDLTDVETGPLVDGYVLTYDSDSPSGWKALPAPGGGALDDLTDVDTSGVSDGYVLTYDADSPSGWKARAPTGGGSTDLVVYRLVASTTLGTNITFNVNSTSYILSGNLFFTIDLDAFMPTDFRIVVISGQATEATRTVTLQLVRSSSATAVLHTGGDDIVVDNVESTENSGWRSFDNPSSLTGFQELALALKGSTATVDLAFRAIEVHFKR